MGERSLSLSSVRDLSNVSEVSETYDKLSRLATIEAAERHMKARKVRRLKGTKIEELADNDVCLCCRLPVPDENLHDDFSLRSDCREFAELGAAFPMYFLMERYLAGILATGLVAALPNLVCNALYDNQGYDSLFGRLSIKGTNKDLSWWNVFLFLIAQVWMCSLYLQAKNRLKWWATYLRGDYVTMADYSVTVKGLGEDWDRKELVTHLEERMKVAGESVKVESITTSYDVAELAETIEKYEELRREKERASYPDSVTGLCCTCIKDELITDVRYQEELLKIESTLSRLLDKSRLRKTGIAIITFSTIAQTNRFISQWGERGFRQVLTALGINCCKSDPALTFNGKPIHITRAMEPLDVLWENLGYSPSNRILRQLVVGGVLLVFLALSFVVVLFSAIGNSYMNTHKGYGLPSSVVFSLIIVVANKILAIVVSILPIYECHHSGTGQALFSAVKVTFVQLINTLLDPLLLDIVMLEVAPDQNSQFADNVTMACIMMIFVETLIDVVPDVTFWAIKRSLLYKRLRAGSTFISQIEANESVELPEPEIAIWYGETMVKYLYALAYFPFAPIVIPITLAGTLLEYWYKKIFLIKWATRPTELNERLCLSMFTFVRLGFPIFGVSTFFSVYLCLYDLRSGATIVALLCIAVGVLFAVSSSSWFRCCFNWVYSKRKVSTQDYQAESPHFLYRYKDSNPVTKFHSKKRFHDSLNSSSGSSGAGISPVTIAVSLLMAKKEHLSALSVNSSRRSSRAESSSSASRPLLVP